MANVISKIVIVLGSESDLKHLYDSKASEMIEVLGLQCEISAISAHRNPDDLRRYCKGFLPLESGGNLVFIAAAGKAAALPSAIASYVEWKIPVIGVPLPSTGFENCLDAFLSMWRMPAGLPVLVVDSFDNAVIAACQILAKKDSTLKERLRAYFTAKRKQPKLNLPLEPKEKKRC